MTKLLETVLFRNGFEPALALTDQPLAAAIVDLSSGLETALALRRSQPDLPILLISGLPAAGPLPVDGPASFLQKPFTTERMLAALDALLSRGG